MELYPKFIKLYFQLENGKIITDIGTRKDCNGRISGMHFAKFLYCDLTI